MHPYIYRTHDGGKTWREITGGLPNSPANSVREDPVRKGLLFAGTETAVWVSFDDGDQWQSLQLNLPHSSMRDLLIHENDLIVATHGRSFWILDDISPLRQLTPAIANSETGVPHLFTPEPAYRVRRDTNTDTPLPADEPAGENPPDGAILDYLLPKSASGLVTLEILNAQGKLVRRYSSTDKPEQTQEELEKQLIPLYWLRPQRILPAESGMHRWVWDLRYPPPHSTDYEYPIAAVPSDTPRYPLGPLVLPGKYSARLTVGGHTETAEFTVKMDPRVQASPADLQKQFELEMKVASGESQSSEALTQARSIDEQITKLLAAPTGQLKDSLTTLGNKVSELLEGDKDTTTGGMKEPALTDTTTNLIALYKAIDQADAAPTVAQIDASTKNEAALKPKRLSGMS